MSLAYSDYRSTGSSTSLLGHARPALREQVQALAVCLTVWVFCYWITSAINLHRDCTRVWSGAWDRAMPYTVWMIVPYVSMNALYVLAPFCCRTRDDLQTLLRRVVAANAVAGMFFVFFPTEFPVVRPTQDGLVAQALQSLLEIDIPNNVFPSLHVAFTIVLGASLMRPCGTALRLLIVAWCALIAVATLLTHQHVFIDATAGGLLGWACCRYFPHAEPQADRAVRLEFARAE